MAGVKISPAILVHELHQREQDTAAGFAEVGVDCQRRYLGDLAGACAHLRQIEHRLQWKPKHPFADHRYRAHHTAVPFGAQRGGGGQGVVDRHPQPRRIGLHEAGRHIGVMQDSKAGLQLVLGVGDLQFEPGVGLRIAVDQLAVKGKSPVTRQQRHQRTRRLMPELAGHRDQGSFHWLFRVRFVAGAVSQAPGLKGIARHPRRPSPSNSDAMRSRSAQTAGA